MISTKSYRSGGAGSKILEIAYGYDELGNVVSRSDTSYGSAINETYGYDGLNRLTTYAGGFISASNGTHVYDALGNLTSKPGAGAIGYSATKRYQATGNGTAVYVYDLNGNRTSGDGLALTWNSFNMVRDITKNSNTARYWYGPNRQRITAHDQATGELTHYVGDFYERKAAVVGSGDREKFYVNTPSGRTAVRVLTNSGFSGLGVKLRYFHADSQGSIFALTTENATLERQFTYDPWGQQSTRFPTSGGAEIVDRRGYTDHEMLVDYGLIHMNGCLFDYKLGRFVSADPFVDDASDSQSYNRYSYVNNSPLVYTDPSGFIKFKDILKIAAVVVAAAFKAGTALYLSGGVTGLATGATLTFANAMSALVGSGGLGMSLGGAIAAGAGAGFASGFAGSLLNGGSLGDAFKAGAMGAVVGAVSGGIAHGIGTFAQNNAWFEGLPQWASHGVAQGGLAEVQGGKFQHGFAAGFFSSAAAPNITAKVNGDIAKTIASAFVGGTASSLGGGKFANGAVSGAFTYMFNQAQDGARSEEELAQIAKWKSDAEKIREIYQEVWEEMKDDLTIDFGPGLGEMPRSSSAYIDRVNEVIAKRFGSGGTINGRTLVDVDGNVSYVISDYLLNPTTQLGRDRLNAVTIHEKIHVNDFLALPVEKRFGAFAANIKFIYETEIRAYTAEINHYNSLLGN